MIMNGIFTKNQNGAFKFTQKTCGRNYINLGGS